MTKFTNNTSGPKAVNTSDRGVVILAKGESADLDVSEADAKAIKDTGLLDGDGTSAPSLADLQREIASGGGLTGLTDHPATDSDPDDLPPENDAEVQALKDDNTAEQLREIADGMAPPVVLESDDNKTDMARKIIAARRATA